MRNFSKKPLVEAVLEIQFSTNQAEIPKLQQTGQLFPFVVDSNFKIFFARFYDRVVSNNLYPEYYQLPHSEIPEELAMHIVQHRFTSTDNRWPMVQLGPGILTLNETSDYNWNDFSQRAKELFSILCEVHPKKEEIKISNITLRYINAIPVNNEEDIYTFLKDNMKINIEFNEDILNSANVQQSSDMIRLTNTFNSSDPESLFINNIDLGEHNGVKSIIWEIICRNRPDSVFPTSLIDFELWLDGAHRIIDRWFMETVKGKLEKGFD